NVCAIASVWLAAAGVHADAGIAELYFGVIDPPVVAQHDITVRAATSNHPLDPRPLPLECSGVAWLNDADGGRLLISSDRHDHVMFTAAVDLPRGHVAMPVEQVIVRNEKWRLSDIEALTIRGTDHGDRAYAMCSMSNDPDGQP